MHKIRNADNRASGRGADKPSSATRELPGDSYSVSQTQTLLEFCCGKESELGRVGGRMGWKVIRLTKEHDLMSMNGLCIALDSAKKNPGCHLWGSLPCTRFVC